MKFSHGASLAFALFGTLGLACSSGSSDSDSNAAADPDALTAGQELSTSSVLVSPGEETASTDGSTPAGNPAYPKCHPHLFARGVEYSRALNYHFWLFLRHVDDILKDAPHLKTDTTNQWVYTAPEGGSIELTLTKTAAGVFSVTEGFAAEGSSTYTTVMTGNIDRSNPEDVKKSFSFDFDALHTVIPAAATDKSAGSLAIDYERTSAEGGANTKIAVGYTLTGFVPVYGDPHGPRTGTTSFLREPGVGGAMSYDASVIFFCPANPQGLSAESDVYLRWYVKGTSTSATVEGRADARATGGQFATGDSWVGVACRSVSLSDATSATETGGVDSIADNGYWMVKEEAANGTTVEGSSVGDSTSSDPACDPAFGAVTDLADATNDPTLPTSIPTTGAFPGQF